VLKNIKDYYGVMELAHSKLAAQPEDDSPATEQLSILDGYSCAACRYLTVARDNIVRHWRRLQDIGEEEILLRLAKLELHDMAVSADVSRALIL
jgi:hypothetical protein